MREVVSVRMGFDSGAGAEGRMWSARKGYRGVRGFGCVIWWRRRRVRRRMRWRRVCRSCSSMRC